MNEEACKVLPQSFRQVRIQSLLGDSAPAVCRLQSVSPASGTVRRAGERVRVGVGPLSVV